MSGLTWRRKRRLDQPAMSGLFDLKAMALRIPALLIAITFHEYAHARMAYHFGDPTAKAHGRLTLNPLQHLDPMGTLTLLLFGIGWAKPVPINPYYFRDYRKGIFWVSLAGPLTNFLLAFVSLFLFYLLAVINVGSPLLFEILFAVVWVNIVLGVFNLVPIPPLDGSKIFAVLAPRSLQGFYRQLEPYATVILLLLILTRALGAIIFPVTRAIYAAMTFVIRLLLPI